MTKKTVSIQSKEILDARPLAMLVQIASRYASAIYLEVGDVHINAKSIMGVMSLILDENAKVVVVADGEDEDQAIAGIEDFFKGKNID